MMNRDPDNKDWRRREQVNFMMWQSFYSEWFPGEKTWPEFTKKSNGCH